MTINENNNVFELELRIKSQLQYLSTVRNFIKTISEMKQFDNDLLLEITLVLDEAVANIIEHGYKLSGDKEVFIKIWVDPEKVEIRIIDFSDGFDFDKAGNVNLDVHRQARKNRGLGVYIIKKIMDKTEYKRDPVNGNELKLIKYLKKPIGE